MKSFCKIAATAFLLLLVFGNSFCQIPFHRGVNLSNWFQTGSAGQIQFAKYTRQDFVNIKSLGCDVVRLPINLHYMTNGSPDYILDPLFFSFLDSAVTWAEDQHIYLLLDDHTFDPVANTDPNIGSVLDKVWPQMARHYKNRSNYIMYEVLNEPHGLTTATWCAIQQTVIDSIRRIDTRHTIVVGPSGYNTYTELANMPVYADTNLIYTFHFYDPFMFTHQGASWVSPSMVPLSGVPFPYNAATMPSCPSSLIGTWIDDNLKSYPNDGNVAHVKSLIDIAVDFKNSRHVKLYCGEFGVYNLNSSNSDRTYWYSVVRQYLEEKGIPWTTWDYQGSFGLFKKGSNELFKYDLNTDLLNSLGLQVPPQSVYNPRPDSAAFFLYSDYLEPYVFESSYGTATIDYYNTQKPNNGTRCIYWTGGDQYNVIGFDFIPDKDLSKLKSQAYALDFFVRGDTPGTAFDMRFIDTKAGPGDHPWRMKTTIDDSKAAWDNHWHHVRVPLSSFEEGGSWDNGTWYNAEGLFNWSAIDRFEIDAEYFGMTGRQLWFDNIQVTNIDTSAVLDTSSVITDTANITAGIRFPEAESLQFSISPNPVAAICSISYRLPSSESVKVSIYNIQGQEIATLVNQVQPAGSQFISWDTRQNGNGNLPRGIYLCRLATSGGMETIKLIKE